MNQPPPLAISQVPDDGTPRPFWSVMIPVYNPPADYLEQTLCSILAQDPGPDQMQIEVVDDCSPKVDVAALVRAIAGERVKISQTPKNIGLAGCWNTCIERARGEWVHIFHQDDLVLPGFYARLGSVAQAVPAVGMVFCRFAVMDENGHWQGLGALEQKDPGLLENWLERVVTGHHLECPAVIVKRSVYGHLGGFSHELNFALDLEMWIRIAAHYPVGYEPAILACYRRHGGSETARLEQGGGNMMDVARAMKICRAYLPPPDAERLIPRAEEFWAGTALLLADRAYAADNLLACTSQLASVRALCNRGACRRRRLKLAARAGLKRVLGPKLVAAIRRWRSTK
jgi:glycosyltransferase involved in cell wall biosynthesis